MNRKMLKITTVALALSSFSYAQTNDAPLKGCAKKAHDVNTQIALAKKAGNTHKVDGLNIALEEIKAHCSDEKIISDIEKGIAEAQEELTKHKEDLKEAQAEQKSDKIEKYTEKIKEDEAEIVSLQAQLLQMTTSR